MRRGSALLVRCAVTDHGLAADQRRPLRFRGRPVDGGGNGGRIVAVHVAYYLPAVTLETRRRVVREPAADVAIDRDVVVVVERDQLAELQCARQRTRFV